MEKCESTSNEAEFLQSKKQRRSSIPPLKSLSPTEEEIPIEGEKSK